MAFNEDTKPGSAFYLTNKELLPEVIKCIEANIISNNLASMLKLLVERYASRANFYGYSYKEDMQGEALCSLMKNALKFDVTRSSNPFAFYTSCIHNSFLGYMSHEKKQQRIRDQMLVDAGECPSYSFQDEYREGIKNNSISDNMRELAEEMEAARERLAKIKDIEKEKENNSKEGLIDFE